MDCHGGAAVSGALNAATMGMPGHHVMHHDPHAEMMEDHLPPEAMAHENWASDFMHLPPDQQAMLHEQAFHEAMAAEHHAMEQEFLAQQEALHAAEEHHAMEGAFSATEHPSEWADQFHDMEGEAWAEDFANEGVQVFGVVGEQHLSYEEKLKDSKFYDFMNKIHSGEVVIEESGGRSTAPDGEREKMLQEATAMNPDTEAWANELAGLNGLGTATGEDMDEAWAGAEGEEALNEAWGETEQMDDFSAEFLAGQGNAMEGGDEDPNMWAEEFAQFQQQFQNIQDSTDYPFDPNNPYLFHENPFAEGESLLAAGNVSEAVLAFEAACQKDGQCCKFWQTLGTTQAENEKDQLAIKALNRAREIDPKNLAVHMSLAVSHTNEGNHVQALRSLKDWIKAHPEGDAICGFMQGMTEGIPMEAQEDEPFARDFMFISPSEHREVCALYDAAIEMNPTDAELHIGLGILRNLSHEFDLAAKSFERALQIRPNDAKLWNKLGATLANGNRSREALAAYDRALDLNPGYVRAQYNLGVSHSNLGEHDLAVRQFLRAIVMQQGGVVGGDEPGANRSTRELWDILRMTLNLMERPDLVSLAWKQDCRPFLQEFGLTELM